MTTTEDRQPGHPLGVPAAGQPSSRSARETVHEMIDAGLLDDVLNRVDAGGLALTGEGGFLPEMVKACPRSRRWPGSGARCRDVPALRAAEGTLNSAVMASLPTWLARSAGLRSSPHRARSATAGCGARRRGREQVVTCCRTGDVIPPFARHRAGGRDGRHRVRR